MFPFRRASPRGAAARGPRVIAAALSLAVSLALAAEAEVSEFHSLRQTRHFFGDIGTHDGFKEMVESRSFRSEIIQLAVDDRRLDFGINTISWLRDLGFEHYILLSHEAGCRKLAAITAGEDPPLSCAWSSEPGLCSREPGDRMPNHPGCASYRLSVRRSNNQRLPMPPLHVSALAHESTDRALISNLGGFGGSKRPRCTATCCSKLGMGRS